MKNFWTFKNFFSFKGRINRLPFLIGIVAQHFLLYFVSTLISSTSGITSKIEAGMASGDPKAIAIGVITLFTLILILGVVISSFISMVSFAVRRLHDMDSSGWWFPVCILIPGLNIIFGLILFLKKGTPDFNKYGPDPLNPEPPEVNDLPPQNHYKVS